VESIKKAFSSQHNGDRCYASKSKPGLFNLKLNLRSHLLSDAVGVRDVHILLAVFGGNTYDSELGMQLNRRYSCERGPLCFYWLLTRIMLLSLLSMDWVPSPSLCLRFVEHSGFL